MLVCVSVFQCVVYAYTCGLCVCYLCVRCTCVAMCAGLWVRLVCMPAWVWHVLQSLTSGESSSVQGPVTVPALQPPRLPWGAEAHEAGARSAWPSPRMRPRSSRQAGQAHVGPGRRLPARLPSSPSSPPTAGRPHRERPGDKVAAHTPHPVARS